MKSVYARNKSECRRKLREAIVARDGGFAVKDRWASTLLAARLTP